MKRPTYLVLKEITILSLKEKKATRKEFHRNLTLITGGNSSGKSTLIKSIYTGLGAEIKHSGRFKRALPIISVKFEIKGESYRVIRDRNDLIVLDDKGNVLEIFEDDILAYSKFWAKKFDFLIELPNQSHQLVTPPIGWLFLPYYIDQEKGWIRNWNSIKSQKLIKDGRRNMIPYHVGIKINDEFILQSEITALKSQLGEITGNIRVLNNILRKTQEELEAAKFDIDIDAFQKEVTQLLDKCNNLNVKQNSYKNNINDLQNKRLAVLEQIKISEKALSELKKDYEYILGYEGETIECPMCGVVHENTFIQRFELAQDESKIMELLQELYIQHDKLKNNIISTTEKYKSTQSEFQDIQKILSEKQKAIKLADIIENQGKKLMKEKFNTELGELKDAEAELGFKLSKKKDELKSIHDKDRSEEIRKKYLSLMRTFLNDLNFIASDEKNYKSIDSSIINEEIGNAVPRMLLAYFFAIFHIMHKYSSTVYCPIIIDEPNQQGPDKENYSQIVNFIKKNQPKGSQMILSIEDTDGIEFGGKVIQLEKDIDLLTEEEFESISEEIMPLIQKSHGRRKRRLF